MADIKAFKAYRYNKFLADKIKELTAPLNESLRSQKKANFYQIPFHYYHISSPVDVPPFENIKRRLEYWQFDKVIQQDFLPAIYTYSQSFYSRTYKREYTRQGFICQIKAESFDKKIVLPHEETFAKAVEYRQNLLEHGKMHTIPTHGFYTDQKQEIEQYIRESLAYPIYSTYQNGVKHSLAQIQDLELIRKFVDMMKDKQVFLADGHHRYESSVNYKRKRIKENSQHTGEEAYNYHLMWLTNTESSDLGVFPTHRIVHSLSDFSQETFIQKLSHYFDIKKLSIEEGFGTAPSENLWTFLVIFEDKHYQITLRKEAFDSIDLSLPSEVKQLDITVLHHFILEKTLGIEEEKQWDFLQFTHFINECMQEVKQKKANFAVITRKVTLEEIKAICKSNYNMPAKTTYFYPKVLGGLVFSKI